MKLAALSVGLLGSAAACSPPPLSSWGPLSTDEVFGERIDEPAPYLDPATNEGATSAAEGLRLIAEDYGCDEFELYQSIHDDFALGVRCASGPYAFVRPNGNVKMWIVTTSTDVN